MATEQEQAGQEIKKGGKKKLIFVIVPIILLLIGGGIGGFFFLTHKNKTAKKEPTFSPQKVGVMYDLGDFLVNLAGNNPNTYAKVSITLELSNQKAKEEVDKRLPIIKDAIIDIISSKTYKDLATTEGKEELRLEIMKRINAILIEGGVENVYFTQFVVQSV